MVGGVIRSCLASALVRGIGTSTIRQNGHTFDKKILEILVCPLSKAPLRYDEETNELVCDKLGVAYPIVNGIPNLVPTDARKVNAEPANKEDTETKS